jgi:hypothetical protein
MPIVNNYDFKNKIYDVVPFLEHVEDFIDSQILEPIEKSFFKTVQKEKRLPAGRHGLPHSAPGLRDVFKHITNVADGADSYLKYWNYVPQMVKALENMGFSEEDGGKMAKQWIDKIPPKYFEFTAKGLTVLDQQNWEKEHVESLIEFAEEKGLDFTELLRLFANSADDQNVSKTLNNLNILFELITKNMEIYYITRFGRYTIKMLKENLEPTTCNKNAVIITARNDWNDALYESPHIPNLMKHHYCISIYETDNDAEFFDIIIKKGSFQDGIDLLYINAHGSKDSFKLGKDGEYYKSSAHLEIEDVEKLDENTITLLKQAFKPNAQIILESCLTCSGGPDDNNIAHALFNVLGAQELFACNQICSLDTISWNRENRVRAVNLWERPKTPNGEQNNSDEIVLHEQTKACIVGEAQEVVDATEAKAPIKKVEVDPYVSINIDHEQELFLADIFPTEDAFKYILDNIEGSELKEEVRTQIETSIRAGKTRYAIEEDIGKRFGYKLLIPPEDKRDVEGFIDIIARNLHKNKSIAYGEFAYEVWLMMKYMHIDMTPIGVVNFSPFLRSVPKNDSKSYIQKAVLAKFPGAFKRELMMIHPTYRNDAEKRIEEKFKSKYPTRAEFEKEIDKYIDEHPSEFAFVDRLEKVPLKKRKKAAMMVISLIQGGHNREYIVKQLGSVYS